ncbi:MAG: hypothetical protein JST67_07425, partial [Bacteroidetes bacterium]|nr:hypothetical protein [Bacteroidota bacterium]
MKIFLLKCIFLGICTFFFCTGKAQEKPSALRFSGFVGHFPSLPTNEKVAAVPLSRIKQECFFYKGDSLLGFDFDKESAAIQQDFSLYYEYKVIMMRIQKKFVMDKYHIQVPSNQMQSNSSFSERGAPPSTLASACNNLDFENGNFTNWTVKKGYNNNSNAALTTSGAGSTSTNQSALTTCKDVNIITAAYGNDPAGGSGYPGLDPSGGSYSVLMGGYNYNQSGAGACSANGGLFDGANGEVLSQTFLVSAGVNDLFSYDYMVFLNDGGHSNGQQPYFQVIVKNASTGVILSSCTQYSVQIQSGVAPAGFSKIGYTNSSDGTSIYACNWVSNSINLVPFVGQNITVQFTTAGCTGGAHPAWAYVDARCAAAQVTVSSTSPCVGTTGILTAPPVNGGTYAWSGPAIVGPTTSQSISVNASGTYSVAITPPQGGACTYTLSKNITFNPTPTVTVNNPTICNGGTATLTANGATTYTWTGGSTSNPYNVSPSSNASYTVIGANGTCTNTAVSLVTVNPMPTLTVNSASVCSSSGGAALTASGASTYSWSPATGLSATTGASVIANPPSTTVYTVTGTTGGGCTSTATSTVTIAATPTVAVTNSVICSNTKVVLTASGASSYTWSTGGSISTVTVLPTSTTNYTVVGANGTCTASAVATVSVITNPTVTVSNANVCSGTSGVLTASGANTYTWSTSATGANL